jgi:hypothetical protein
MMNQDGFSDCYIYSQFATFASRADAKVFFELGVIDRICMKARNGLGPTWFGIFVLISRLCVLATSITEQAMSKIFSNYKWISR